MKKQILLPLILITASITTVLGQYSTGTTGLGGMYIKIDTNPTSVTMTLTAPSDKWIGIGFAGATMATTTDMFIWNDTPDRDYTVHTVGNSGHNMPTPDAVQSWTMVSDTVASGIRTIVATRSLVSAGDYTFTNNTGFIQIIYALGVTTSLAYHDTNLHNSAQLTRFVLALEEFSLKATSIYPNPSKGTLTVKTNTSLNKITIYSQNGEVVRTIPVESQKEDNELTVSGLAAGVYIFELQNGTEKAWKNVIVE
jgi:Secretion system C-terminal sorting domain/DOMON domain